MHESCFTPRLTTILLAVGSLLLASGGSHAAGDKKAAETSFAERLQAAKALAKQAEKDEAVTKLALEAVDAGNLDRVKSCLDAVSVAQRDKLRGQCAIGFARLAAKRHAEALELAKAITNAGERDALLKKLAAGTVPDAPKVIVKELSAALVRAVRDGDVSQVKQLLAKGANPDTVYDEYKNNVLILAAYKGEKGIVEALLASGAQVDLKAIYKDTALSYAIEQENLAIVNLLLAKGAAVDFQYGWTGKRSGLFLRATTTPLNFAIEKGNLSIVKALLAKGAKVNFREFDTGPTPLMNAAEAGHLAIVKALLAGEADVNMNTPNDNRNTALMLAARKGHVAVVTDLLAVKDVDVGQKNAEGNTALMLAAIEGQVDVVQALLDKGADIAETNKKRQTALDCATEKNHAKVIELLKKAAEKK